MVATKEVIECFEGLIAMATVGAEPRVPPLFGLVCLGWELFIYQFRQMVVCVGIIICGKSEPFPLDVAGCLIIPVVFAAKVAVQVWNRCGFSYLVVVMTMDCFVAKLEKTSCCWNKWR